MQTLASKVFYHGTTAGKFEAFIPKFRKGEQLGFGIHFAEERSFALLYATDPMTSRKGKNPTLYTVSIDAKKVLDGMSIVNKGSPEFDLALKLGGKKVYISKTEDGTPCLWMQHAIDATTPQRAQTILQDDGYDAVIYESKVGVPGINARVTAKCRSIVIINPNQIRILDVELNPSIDNDSGKIERALTAISAINEEQQKTRKSAQP